MEIDWFALTFTILFYLLSLIGLLTNAFLVFAIPFDRTLRSRSLGVFLFAISLGYLLASVLHAPFGVQSASQNYGTETEAFVRWLCNFAPIPAAIAVRCELLSLLCIGVCYWLEMRPSRRRPVDFRTSYPWALLFTFVVVLVAAGSSVPSGVFKEVTLTSSNNTTDTEYECVGLVHHRNTDTDTQWVWYLDFWLLLTPPLILILDVIYTVVGYKSLSKSGVFTANYATKELKALILMTAKLNLAILPLTIADILVLFFPDILTSFSPDIFVGLHFLHDLSLVCNFFIFLIIPGFRHAYRKYLLFWRRTPSSSRRAVPVADNDSELQESAYYY